jgi:hypothetical protein
MVRKALFVIAFVSALAVAACSKGPNEPMPGDDDMMQTPATTDTVSRR